MEPWANCLFACRKWTLLLCVTKQWLGSKDLPAWQNSPRITCWLSETERRWCCLKISSVFWRGEMFLVIGERSAEYKEPGPDLQYIILGSEAGLCLLFPLNTSCCEPCDSCSPNQASSSSSNLVLIISSSCSSPPWTTSLSSLPLFWLQSLQVRRCNTFKPQFKIIAILFI